MRGFLELSIFSHLFFQREQYFNLPPGAFALFFLSFFGETAVLISSFLFNLYNNSQWKEEIGF